MTRDPSAKNDKTLRQLVAAIARSQGQFKLILVRCDYTQARSQWTQRLTDRCHSEHGLSVPVLTLPKTGTTLYSCIGEFLQARGELHGVQVVGLEGLAQLDALLANANQVRENLREFPFPVLVWLDDAVLRRFMQQASDLFSWATTKRFVASDAMLTEALGEKIRLFFDRLATATDAQLLARADLLTTLERSEARTAQAELDRRAVELDAARHAQLAIVFGRDVYRHGDRGTRLAEAKARFESSLEYWDGDGRSHPDATIGAGWARFYLALVALSEAETDAALRESARDRFVAAAATFEQGDRAALAERCRGCSAWRLLEARLEADRRYEAGDLDGAIAALEELRGLNPSGFPKLYLSGLERLQSLYFNERRDYLAAYLVQGEQNATERRYGLRAFIGAGRLEPIEAEPVDRGGLTDDGADALPPEIDRAGRGDDVRNLLERIGRNDHKLVVLSGPSGVGKSSLVNAGLVPALRGQTIGIRDVAVAVVRVYRDWPRELAKALAAALAELRGTAAESLGNAGGTGDRREAIRATVRAAAARNEAVVFVLDQFEEFFFANPSLREHREFFRFIGGLLDEPELLGAVKVVLSLRDDYLHYLLVCNRMEEMRGIGQDVLSKNVLYSIGNLSRDRTVAVVRTLVAKTALYLEEGLLARFVEDLADDVGEVRPIELQIAGSQLQAQGVMTLAAYEGLATERESSKEVLVRGYLDSVVVACGEENHRLADLVLFLLTDERGTRPLRTEEELEKDLREWGTESAGLGLVLEIFVLSGLVVVVPGVPRDRFQLVHDYLAVLVRQTRASELQEVMVALEAERTKRQHAEATLKDLQKTQDRVVKRTQLQGIAGVLMIVAALGTASWIRGQAQLELKTIQEEYERVQETSRELRLLDSLIRTQPLQALSRVIEINKKNSGQRGRDVLIYSNGRSLFYLNRILSSSTLENTLSGHDDVVSDVDFSPNGELIASASRDSTVKIWNAEKGEEVMTLFGHSDFVNSVEFSPDGTIVISAASDGTIKSWDVSTGREEVSFSVQEGVLDLSFNSDGSMFASASEDGVIELWDTNLGTRLRVFEGHRDSVRSVRFSMDDKMLVSASADTSIKVWDVKTGSEYQTLSGHLGVVYSAEFSNDNRLIVSASSDDTVKVWNANTGLEIQSFNSHSDDVRSAKFGSDRRTVASASTDNTIKLWDTIKNREIHTFYGHSGWIEDIEFSPDNSRVVSASHDNKVKIWKLPSSEEYLTLLGHSSWVRRADFHPLQPLAISASSDSSIKLWDLETGQELMAFKGHLDRVYDASFSRDGQSIVSASKDGTVKLWNVSTQKDIKTLLGHSSDVYSASFSPDGTKIVSASNDGTAKIWDAKSGKVLHTLIGHTDWVLSAGFSPDGKTVVSTSRDETIKLWDVRNGEEIKTLYGHSGWVFSAKFSSDGKTLVSASQDATIRLWDVYDGKEKRVLNGHSSWVYSASFSPNEEYIISASRDSKIKRWDVRSGEELQTFNGHEDWVYDARFSPDGSNIISASADTTVRLWQVETLDELIDRACRRLTPWLNNPNGGATDEQRAVCDLPPRNPTN